MNTVQPRVAALIRVSTEEQAKDDRAGIARQEYTIAQTVKANDLNRIRTVTLSDVSGTNTHNAPEVQRLLQEVSEGILDGLVVADLDRLMRPAQLSDLAILSAFERAGARIYCGDQVIDLASDNGFMMAGVKSILFGMELRNIRQRVWGGKEAKRRQGQCPSSAITMPTGIAYNREAERFITTDAIVAVKEAFRLVDEDGVTNISELSRRVGIQHRTLHNILRNPIYMGQRVIDKKRGPTKYTRADGRQADRRKVLRAENEIIRVKVFDDPPVSAVRFQRVQRILEHTFHSWRSTRHTPPTDRVAVGLAHCAVCGARMYASSGKRKGRIGTSYYFCARNHYQNKRTTGGCPQSNVRADVLDATIKQLIERELSRPEVVSSLLRHHLDRVSAGTSEVDTVPPAAAWAEARRSRLLDLYEGGTINKEELTKRLGALEQRRAIAYRVPDPQAPSPDTPTLARCLVRGALACGRASSALGMKTAIRQLFARFDVRNAEIVGFALNPRLDAYVGEDGSRTGRDSWPPPA
jgi:DNA invertase Pin-like site-specific DNA recombinase